MPIDNIKLARPLHTERTTLLFHWCKAHGMELKTENIDAMITMWNDSNEDVGKYS